MFSPSTGLHEVRYLALDLEAEQPVLRGNRPRWPQKWLKQEDINASADALAFASASVDAATAPITAVKIFQRHVLQK